MSISTILVPLLDQGTDVWAPVSAEEIEDNHFRVLGPMPADQKWAFLPGTVVLCALKSFQDGSAELAAVREVAR